MSNKKIETESLPKSSNEENKTISARENHGNTLYVSGLSSRTTEEDLMSRFSKCGEVVSCTLVKQPHSSESRGFGFVVMATVEGANGAIETLNRTEVENRVITVEKARRGRGRSPTPGKYLGRTPSRSSRPYDRPRGHERSYDRSYDRYDRDSRYDRSYDRYDPSYERSSSRYDSRPYDRSYDRSRRSP